MCQKETGPEMALHYVVYYDTGDDADYCVFEYDCEGRVNALEVFAEWIKSEWLQYVLSGFGIESEAVTVAVIKQALPVAEINDGDFNWWGFGFQGSADILRLSFNGGVK